ncbi:MAG: Pr6Pr family membrane protein [Spirochaetales bacterium]|nr:Pr6Pr family membrane protein [Spirochaetales bacterium]
MKSATLTAARLLAHALVMGVALAGVYILVGNPFEGQGKAGMLRYFTIQSNLLVAALALAEFALVALGRMPGRRFARARGFGLVAISLTGSAYALFLARVWSPTGMMAVGDTLAHYVSPLAALAIWALFSEKGKLRLRDAALWLAYPAAYLVWSQINGALTGFYPYWFVNPKPAPEGLGSAWLVLAFAAGTCAVLWLLGAALVGIDRALARKRGSRGASVEGLR